MAAKFFSKAFFANIFGKRNVRYGFVSVCITVVVIAVIVLVNVVLTTLFKKYPLDIDLTEDQIFEISRETRDYLKALDERDQDVTIYVLNTEASFTAGTSYFIQANEVIRKYAQYSSRINLEYVDLIRNPDFTARYPGMNLSMSDILLVSGNRTRALTPPDLFNIQSNQYGQQQVISSKAEQAMTGALLAVTSQKVFVATVIEGHGEIDFYPLTELLQTNAWELRTCNTMTESIPPDTDLLILAAPERDLSVEETREIDRFLEGSDGRVFFYTSAFGQANAQGEPDQAVTRNLDAFLAEWGLAVDPGMVFEGDNRRILGGADMFTFLADFVSDEYSEFVMGQGLPPVLPMARPLRLVFNQERYRSTQVLVRSSASSGIRPAYVEDWTPSAGDLKPEIPLVAMSTNTRNNVEGAIVSSRVVVCGTVYAFSPSLLGDPRFANSRYFLDLLGGLTGREEQFYVQDKTLGFSRLSITASQVIILALIFIVLVPLAVLGTGIGVWLRRRHK